MRFYYFVCRHKCKKENVPATNMGCNNGKRVLVTALLSSDSSTVSSLSMEKSRSQLSQDIFIHGSGVSCIIVAHGSSIGSCSILMAIFVELFVGPLSSFLVIITITVVVLPVWATFLPTPLLRVWHEGRLSWIRFVGRFSRIRLLTWLPNHRLAGRFANGWNHGGHS